MGSRLPVLKTYETADEGEFFQEPGFLVAFSVTSPKVYFGGLAGFNAGFAKRAWDWMPSYVMDMPETSLKYFSQDTGPLGNQNATSDRYYIDMRDELLFGDQFQNVAPFGVGPTSSYANHILPLPAGAVIGWKYPTEAMAKAFFVDTSTAAINQDGYFSFSIKGKQVNYTEGNFAQA